MGLGLALVPALGGFLFLLLCNATRPGTRQSPGYHLVFASALAGVVFYAISFLAAASLDLGDAEVVRAALAHGALDGRYGTAVSAAVLSLSLPPVAAWVANRWVSREKADRRAAIRAGRLREIVLHDAMRERGLVEVSLETGKSYVAFVQQVVIAQPHDTDVVLVPVLSGYRHANTGDLHLTIHYAPILDRVRAVGMTGDLPVGVALSRIVSVRPFDLAIWREFTRASRSHPAVVRDGWEPAK